jgi:hypothetical protein
MQDSKIRGKGKDESELMAWEINERLDRADMEDRWRLEALDFLISESRENPEQFHQEYVGPLLEAGLNMDTAFDLIVNGVFRAN